MEQWKPVEGFPGYDVSDLGRIRSWRYRNHTSPRIIKAAVDEKGYRIVRLNVASGVRKTVRVHRLVALTFLGERPEGLQIRHVDSDKANNAAANLAYGTQLENMADRVALKSHCKQGHPFDAANTIRRPNGSRGCRACQRLADERRRPRRKVAA